MDILCRAAKNSLRGTVGLKCIGHSFDYVTHFCVLERCLDSNPVCCNSKQALYQISHTFP
jgi:hypothetical protein